MKVLVTGGAGYIGTSLIPQLLEAGHHVRVFDALLFGGDQLLPFFQNRRFEFMKGDIRNTEEVKGAVRGQDAIVHLAAIVGYPACRKDPVLAAEVNVGGTRTLASALSRQQLVIVGSTGSNYGAVEYICTEDTPLNPLSLYGQTKTIAENHLLENCSTIAFRFATAFGLSPRLRLDLLVNDFSFKAVTQQYLVVYEADFMRTFIHVRDIGRALMLALDNADRMRGEVYNVGSEHMNLSKRDVCDLIQKKVSCYVHYAEFGEDADKRNYVVSYEKIKKLGYDTAISVEEGVSELVKGFQVLGFKSPYSNV